MTAKSPVVLIFGAGANIGKAVARNFASKGYKVALAARSLKDDDSTDDQLNIPSDVSNTENIVNAFAKVKKVFGIPSVVVYNGKHLLLVVSAEVNWHIIASAVTFTPADDPLSLSLADLNRDTNININSAFVAAQQAVSGFSQLPESASRTFIYTGNVLNVAIIPKFMSQGIGKSGAAH